MTCRRFHIRRLFYIALVEFCSVNSVATIFLPASERTREQFVLDALVALLACTTAASCSQSRWR